jgi:anti-anti-sigma regulatory factor
MNTTAANLLVWVGENVVWIKIVGRATFTSSVDFKSLINQLWQKGSSRFVVDLTDCVLMDSTFLGVLSGLGLKFSNGQPGPSAATIELLNPNTRISDLLENLGVAHLFKVCKGRDASAPGLTPLDQTNADRKEIQRTCLEAHETLMDINPNNVPKFKDVARFLAEDLQKMEDAK